MTDHATSPFPETAFWTAYQGRFFGILNWPDVTAFWATMAATSGDWYVFDPANPAPEAPVSAVDLSKTLTEAAELIETRRDRSHCGAIYVDNTQNPTFIKIFDPAAMGSACNISGIPILPRWIISRAKPDTLPAPAPVAAKPNLFKRMTGRA